MIRTIKELEKARAEMIKQHRADLGGGGALLRRVNDTETN